MIDIGPMRRDIVRQFVPEGQWEKLSEDDRRRIMSEVNQRMMGIAQGIQLGAAEAQKRVAEAKREADEKVQADAKIAAAERRKHATRGTKSRAAGHDAGDSCRCANGAGAPQVGALRLPPRRHARARRQSRPQANAEVNLPNLLATVFTTTRRDRGEVPFAVGKDGKLYTPTAEDKKKLETLGGNITSADSPAGTTRAARLDRRDHRRSDRIGAAVRHRAAGRRFAATSCAGQARATPGSASASSASRSSASCRCRRG